MKKLIDALIGFMDNSSEYDFSEEVWNAGVDALRSAENWNELTAGEISEIWGCLPQSMDEEKDAIQFGFAIEAAVRRKNDC